jgi:hypothetical protein
LHGVANGNTRKTMDTAYTIGGRVGWIEPRRSPWISERPDIERKDKLRHFMRLD